MTPEQLEQRAAEFEALAAGPGDDDLPPEERRAVRLARLEDLLGAPPDTASP